VRRAGKDLFCIFQWLCPGQVTASVFPLSSGDAKPYVSIVRMLLLAMAVLDREKALLHGLDI